jgi:hypothetical protein
MPVYKLTAPRKYGDMPQGYTFQVVSRSSPNPDMKEIEAEIARLGFNHDAQTYRSSGNWKIEKVG